MTAPTGGLTARHLGTQWGEGVGLWQRGKLQGMGIGGGRLWNSIGANGDEYFPLVGITGFHPLRRELHGENIPFGLGLVSA